MDLVTPGIGLIFWSTLFFLILLLILGKFAWPAIRSAVSQRNESIRNSLEAAERAREEMKKLEASNEKILEKARNDRDEIMKEARTMKEQILADARENAEEESERLINKARESIDAEKQMALKEIKEQIAQFSVEIAENVLREKLSDDDEQQELVNRMVDDLDLN